MTVSNKKFNYPREFEDNYIESLSSDIRKNKNVTDALLLRGSLYLNRGDYTKAIEDFRAVLERDPNHLFALMNLASARSRMYDYIESIEEKTSRVVGEEKKVERNATLKSCLFGHGFAVRQKRFPLSKRFSYDRETVPFWHFPCCQ